MLGVLANSAGVLFGGAVGLALRGRINQKYTSALMAALALVSLGLGIVCVVGVSDTLCLILCVSIGTLLGELLRIDDRVEALGALAEKRLAGGDGGFADRAVHLILPVAVVVLGHLWYYAYLVRSRLIEELRADYILLAKGKGLPKRTVLLRHALRNVLPSYLSIMAISVPHILGGTYIVETVFSYPGLGTLSYESARYQDYNLLMVLCMMTGAAVIVCNLLAQAISARIDPRLAGEEAAHG